MWLGGFRGVVCEMVADIGEREREREREKERKPLIRKHCPQHGVLV